MEGVDSDLQTLRGPGAAILRLLGVWWSQGRYGRLCSAACACVTLSTFAWLASLAALKFVMEPPQQLEEIALCGFVIVICFGYASKVVFFIYKADALQELLQLLSSARRNYGNGESSQNIRNRNLKLSRRLFLFKQVILVHGLAAWFSTPLLARAFHTSDEDSPESARQLPVPLWFPGNIYSSPTYEFLYISQAFSQIVVTQSSTCIDAFFAHIMLMVAAELEVLNENITAMQKFHIELQRTKYRDRKLCTVAKYGEQTVQSNYSVHTTNILLDGFPEEMYRELVKNIQHHHIIFRSVPLLQTVMNVSTFILLFVSMADLCSCIFVSAVVLQRDGNITKALKALMTIPPILYETSQYCIVAQILTDQSEELVNSAVSCGWEDCDARFKRSLLIFMTVAITPLEITVGKICKLSKQMLVQVLNGTYALLNFLYHFHSTQ